MGKDSGEGIERNAPSPLGRGLGVRTAWMQKVEDTSAHPALATFAHLCAAQRRSRSNGISPLEGIASSADTGESKQPGERKQGKSDQELQRSRSRRGGVGNAAGWCAVGDSL